VMRLLLLLLLLILQCSQVPFPHNPLSSALVPGQPLRPDKQLHSSCMSYCCYCSCARQGSGGPLVRRGSAAAARDEGTLLLLLLVSPHVAWPAQHT
jgi:hypothetical protein